VVSLEFSSAQGGQPTVAGTVSYEVHFVPGTADSLNRKGNFVENFPRNGRTYGSSMVSSYRWAALKIRRCWRQMGYAASGNRFFPWRKSCPILALGWSSPVLAIYIETEVKEVSYVRRTVPGPWYVPGRTYCRSIYVLPGTWYWVLWVPWYFALFSKTTSHCWACEFSHSFIYYQSRLTKHDWWSTGG